MSEDRQYALVTGASRGIGLQVALGLAARGFEVFGVGRSAPAAGVATNGVRWQAADLASMRAVRQLADRIAAHVPSLDLLVHNAAVVEPRRVLTADGFERQFAVNHLAVYLLTRLLLPLLERSRAARVVVTASQVERGARLDFEDLQSAVDYDPAQVYARTKLANVLFTYELARRLGGTRITVNCLHPGVVRTDLLENLLAADTARAPAPGRAARMKSQVRGAVGSALRMLRLRPPVVDWALSPVAGAATTLFVATEPSLAGVSGGYFADCAACQSSPQSYDAGLQRRLWDESAKLLGVAPQWPSQ